jgi:hypothetical protein
MGPLPVAMLVYIYYIPAAGIARNSQLSNSYKVREYRPFHCSKNQTFSPPLPSPPTKLVRIPVHSGTLAFNLFGHSWLT